MRTVHVEHCMGTVFSIDVRDPGRLGRADRRRGRAGCTASTPSSAPTGPTATSAASAAARLDLAELDPLVAEVLAECDRLTAETDGYFSASWAGAVDPTGLVKGWAIERASALLRARGSVNHAINGGGDMQLAGESHPGQPWRVGIADPLDRTRVLTVVTGRDIAVATSGTAERGAHIVDPHSGLPPQLLTPAGRRPSPSSDRLSAASTPMRRPPSPADRTPSRGCGPCRPTRAWWSRPTVRCEATPGLRHDPPPRPRQPRQLSVGWSPSASSR